MVNYWGIQFQSQGAMRRLTNQLEEATRRLHKIAFSARGERAVIWPPTLFFFAVLLLFASLRSVGGRAAPAITAPGLLISMTALPGTPNGASAYHVFYESADLSGALIPVSGVVIIPKGTAPPGGRPIVAWTHPTGIVCRWAPSQARVFFASVQGLNATLAHGYIVAATDYPGLGTPEAPVMGL
jgi:hypothetical protein